MNNKPYKVCNWSNYNKALIRRGSINIWLNQDIIDNWNKPSNSGNKGRPQVYSDVVISCCLTIRAVFNLPLRATTGFISSLFAKLNLAIIVPDYTTLCRRQKDLAINICTSKTKQPIDIVIDSIGKFMVRANGKLKCMVKVSVALGENYI